MLTYSYKARDPKSGEVMRSVVQAESEKSVARMIAQQGLAPLEIKLNEQAGILGRLRNRIKTKDRVIMARQLSTLINAGLPITASLRNVQQQSRSAALRMVLASVITSVESGNTLSDSMRQYPRVFNQVFISLVEAGEVSGTLDKALERIANIQEKESEIVSKVRGAMVYPIIVLAVIAAVVIFMLSTVLPNVVNFYKDLGNKPLPFVTKLLYQTSNVVTRFWWLVLLILIGLGAYLTHFRRTYQGRAVIDRLKMSTPPIKGLFMKLYMSRFSSNAATLIASGVPLLQMLSVTAKSVNNVHIEKSLLTAAEKVKGGKSLSSCLMNDPNFLPLLPNMLKIGEDSGSLEAMLAKTAEYYEKEVDNEIKAISTIIEPLLMIVLGVVAMVVVAATLLPIYSLVGTQFIR